MTMWIWIRERTTAPVFEGNPDKTRSARLLNIMLLSALGIMLLGALGLLISGNPLRGLIPLVLVALLSLGLLALMRAGYVNLASSLFSGGLWLMVTGLMALTGGVISPIALGLITNVIVAGLVLGGRGAFIMAGLDILSGIGLVYAQSNGYLPAPVLNVGARMALSSLIGNLLFSATLLYLAKRSLDEALDQAREYATELEDQRAQLETVVEERTQDLSRRMSYLGATTAVAREAVRVMGDPAQLLSRAVNVISDQFDFYHAGIFLVEPEGKWVTLQAASSLGGRRMIQLGHRLEVGTEGIVGYVAEQGEPRVASDVGEDATFFDNPELPETRSELALPLRVRGEMIGVLDVQSREPAAFSDEDVVILQALADQIALAIDSTRLLQQAQESLEAERRAYGEVSRQAWRRLLQSRSRLGFVSEEDETRPAEDVWRAEMNAALRSGETTVASDDGSRLAIPIRVRGNVIGVVSGSKPPGQGEWTREEIELMEALAEQLNVGLESARLYEDTQRRAARERVIGEVTARMRETLDVEAVIRTAAREMRAALDLREVEVQMGGELMSPPTDGGSKREARNAKER
jgi:GAF domain-containing protein